MNKAAQATHLPDPVISDSGLVRSPREWVARALRDGAASADMGGFDPQDLVAVAESDHVLPLLEWQLRDGADWQVLPDEFRQALTDGARVAAMRSLFRDKEQQRIAKVFLRDGIRALLLKGNALAIWLYPQRHLRSTSDIDLLFASREDAHRAAHALRELGYELAFNPGSMNFEMTSRLTKEGGSLSDLDLHCRLINSVFYADIFGFEELWGSSFNLEGLGESVRALSPAHALANACMNRALDMQNGVPDRLKLLYDIHLMLERMNAKAWDELLALLIRKQLCGVCLRTIEDTLATFASPVASSIVDGLRGHANNEPLDYRRLDDWRYMQWRNLKAMHRWQDRVRWVLERLIPTKSHLQEKHGREGHIRLIASRIIRGLSRWMKRRQSASGN